MKTFNSLFFIFLFSSTLLFSQVEEEKKDNFHWGVKAGFNYGTIAAKDIYTGGKSGYEEADVYARLFVEVILDSKFSLQSEFGYSALAEMVTWEFPILTKYRFEDRFQIGLGPKLSYISSKYFYGQTLITRWGVSLESMVQYNIGKHWLLETSYTYEFNKKVDWYSLGFEDGKWRAFRLGLGYKF